MAVFLRRSVLGAGAAAALAARSLVARAAPVAKLPAGVPAYPYSLPPLPYAPDANEPHIDAQTMSLHHDKHHAAYVAKLNEALKDYPQAAALPLPILLTKIGQLPKPIQAAVRNNGGGHAYHSMFWTIMGGKGGAPDGALAAAIARDFGSFEALKTAFNMAGAKQFGSGWAVVLVDGRGKLSLTSKPNQDSPLMEGTRVLFANDVWEHAYYLKYQNRRAEYLTGWWNVVNWPVVAQRYEAALKGALYI